MANELTALSVLLVFISVAFSLLMPKVWEELEWSIDKNIKEYGTRVIRLNAVNNMLRFKVGPFAIFCLIIAYLLTPTTLEIVAKSEFSLWDFELFYTLFVVIHLSIIVMEVIVIKATLDLVKRKKKLLHLTKS